MKSKTKTVGGSPVGGIGQDFNSFLQGGLTSGNFGANATAQTQGFGGAINSLLGGQIGDPSTLQGFLQGLQGNGGVGNLPNVNGNFNSPGFQGLDFSRLGQIGTQGPSLGMGQQNAGLNLGMGQYQQGGGNAGLDLSGLNLPQLNQQVGGAGNLPGVQFNPSQFQNTRLQGALGGAAGLDPNGSFSQALQSIQQNQLNSAVADTRERFTGQSGTPAGFAEAALRAQMAPQLTAALGQANQQERGLNLQQLGMNQDTVNQMNQLKMQQGLAGNQFNQQNSQLGLNAQGINTGNILQNQALQNQGALGLNSQFLQGAGMQQQQQLGLNSNLLQQLGLGNDAMNQFNQLQQNQQMGLNSNLLQQMGLGNQAQDQFNQSNLQQFGQQQQGQQMNVQNMLAQMQQMLGQSQNQNMFNQSNAQFGANLGQQGDQMNAQNMLNNQGQMNQFGLGQANVGMQNQQQQLQAILGALGPLFGGMQQATGLATPQAQTVQKPSMFSQITSGLGSLAGLATPFLGGGLGNLFGGGAMPANLNPQTLQGLIGNTPSQMPMFNMPIVPLGR